MGESPFYPIILAFLIGSVPAFILSFIVLYYQLYANNIYSAVYFVWILSLMIFCGNVEVEAIEALLVVLPVSLNLGLTVLYLANKL